MDSLLKRRVLPLFLFTVVSASDYASGVADVSVDTADDDDDDENASASPAAVWYIYISTGATLFLLLFLFSAGFGWPRVRRVYSPLTVFTWLFLALIFPPFLLVFVIFALLVNVTEEAHVPTASVVVEEEQQGQQRTLSQQERRDRARGINVYKI